jgi:hypothetical protein
MKSGEYAPVIRSGAVLAHSRQPNALLTRKRWIELWSTSGTWITDTEETVSLSTAGSREQSRYYI